METGEDRTRSKDPVSAVVPVELIGEGLLLAALVVAPWVYGAVEDSVRYALCAVLLVAGGLFLWPDLRRRELPRGIGAALAFPAFAIAQIALGQSVAPLLTIEASMVGFSMAMVWAAVDGRSGSTSTNTSRRLAWALLLVCVSESAFAAFQWSTDRRLLFGQRSELQTMPFGSYVNHNNFAGLVSLGVPLAIAMAIGDLRRSGKLTPRGLGLMGLACGLAITVLASGSRGGAVALVFGLAVLAWISGHLLRKEPRGIASRDADRRPARNDENGHRSWLGPLAIGAGVLLIAVLAVPVSTRTRLVTLFDKGGSMNYRVDMGLAALRTFSSRPLLGSGLGAFGDAAAPFKQGHGDVRSERAEADLIEFAVEGGAVLMVALLLFGRFVWRSASKQMVEGRDRSGRWLRAGALAACATMLFHALFDFGFRIPANALAFAVLLGIATAGSEAAPARSNLRRFALLALLVVLGAACAYRSLGAARERAAVARTSPESRLDALQSLVDAHPYLDNARRQRGLAWMALAYSRGRYDPQRLQRALVDLQAVVDARPQWAEARADLGWVKYTQGRTGEAKAELFKASRFDPTHLGVGIAYAQVLAWSGDAWAATEEVSRLRTMNPGWSRARARELVSSWTKDSSILANIP